MNDTEEAYGFSSYGMVSLASAVLCQYRDDRKPKGDAEGARLWKMYLEAHYDIMAGRGREYFLNGIKRRQK